MWYYSLCPVDPPLPGCDDSQQTIRRYLLGLVSGQALETRSPGSFSSPKKGHGSALRTTVLTFLRRGGLVDQKRAIGCSSWVVEAICVARSAGRGSGAACWGAAGRLRCPAGRQGNTTAALRLCQDEIIRGWPTCFWNQHILAEEFVGKFQGYNSCLATVSTYV